MDPQTAAKLSEWAQRHFIGAYCWQGAKRVGLYAAFDNEVDTRLVFERGLAENKLMAFPRVTGVGEMVYLREDRWSDMEPNEWGILEPASSSERIPIEDLDLVAVPGVAFSRDGYRIGFGGGYYDRLLVALRPGTLSVGLAYSFQVLDRLPNEQHDRCVDRVVTEQGFVKMRLKGR